MRKRWFYYLFFIGFPLCLPAQELIFKRITVRDGLSQGHVNTMLKDKDGFTWLGTQDGLNRYDGYQFRTFYHDPKDSLSLSDNYIWRLLEDSQGMLWIGTFGGGLNRFNPDTEQFSSFYPPATDLDNTAKNSIRSLLEYPNGKLWVGTDQGLFAFDLEQTKFLENQSHRTTPDSLPIGIVLGLQPLSDEQLLVGALNQLFILNINENRLKKAKLSHPFNAITQTITSIGNNTYWLGTDRGFWKAEFHKNKDSIQLFGPYQSSRFISDLIKDEMNHWWIATNQGLLKFNSQTDFINYQHQQDDEQSLSHNIVYDLMEVEPGLMWAATREGISQFSVKKPWFDVLQYQENIGGLCANAVLGITQAENGDLWVATKKGLSQIKNFSKGAPSWQVQCYEPTHMPEMLHHYVLNVSPNSSNRFWITFRRNGFGLFEPKLEGGISWKYFNPVLEQLGGAGMNIIYEEIGGVVWLGTPGFGLWKWKPQSNKVEVFTANVEDPTALSHDYVFAILRDYQDQLWIGTANGGLCKMNEVEGTFECYTADRKNPFSISNNMVLSLFEDSHNRLWACTANGLNLMRSEGQFQSFFQKDGLPNDVIYGILEDNTGTLWASTNKGLSAISYHDTIFQTQNYDMGDGLPTNEFNQYSFYKTKSGKLCFGGVNGLVVFDPQAIQPSVHRPPVVFTDFQLFNNSVPISTLTKSINQLQQIKLQYDQNFIAFEFAALGFTQPKGNRYAYKMEGLDADWIYCENRRYASYPNLQPGKYTFMVKASNHDNIWNEKAKTIKITVMPPPWKTWWAYLIYLLLILSIIYAYTQLKIQQNRSIEKAKLAERELFRRRSARDFHDEAGNTITKIALITEMVKRNINGNLDQQHLLGKIEENVQNLRMGMRDFIWVLDPANDNLHATIFRLKDFANDLFAYTDTRFTVSELDTNLQHINLNGEQRRHFLLIFKEAINNSLKYAKASKVNFKIKQEKELLVFTLQDNGKGFIKEQITTGNGLKNMYTRAQKMGGMLELKSSSNEGTSVVLQLDITHLGD